MPRLTLHTYPLGVSLEAMYDVRSHAWAQRALIRVLLVAALAVGLCAMHVFAAAVSQHHAMSHGAMAEAPTVMAMDQHSPLVPAAAAVTTTAATTDHGHHHSMADCVLFLSAGVALLVVLVACAAARALRSSYWLQVPWPRALVLTTPWRGPPPWHWPRVSLCVIRV